MQFNSTSTYIIKSDKTPVTSSKVEAHRSNLVAPQYFHF